MPALRAISSVDALLDVYKRQCLLRSFLSLGREKRAQKLSALVGKDARHGFEGMIEALVLVDRV